jgi:predicted component of type VI protein secretion system
VPVAEAPAMDAPYLQILSGQRLSEAVPLRAGGARVVEWSVGSDPQRDVVLPDDGVSAFHARIMNEGKRWRLVDEMSANGTFVNGKRSSVSYLSGGDRIRFGAVECVFQTEFSPRKAPADAEAPVPAQAPRRGLWAIAVIAVLALLFAAYRLFGR